MPAVVAVLVLLLGFAVLIKLWPVTLTGLLVWVCVMSVRRRRRRRARELARRTAEVRELRDYWLRQSWEASTPTARTVAAQLADLNAHWLAENGHARPDGGISSPRSTR